MSITSSFARTSGRHNHKHPSMCGLVFSLCAFSRACTPHVLIIVHLVGLFRYQPDPVTGVCAITSSQQSLVISILSAGAFVNALFATSAADILGRLSVVLAVLIAFAFVPRPEVTSHSPCPAPSPNIYPFYIPATCTQNHLLSSISPPSQIPPPL